MHWHAGPRHAPGAWSSAWQAAGQAPRALAYADSWPASRVLELWERCQDAAERIGADHVAVLEERQGGRLAGEDDRGITLAQAALREVDPAAGAGAGRAPAPPPRLPEVPSRPGRTFAGDLEEAVRLCRETAEPGAGPGARSAGPLHHEVQRGWDSRSSWPPRKKAVTPARQGR